MRMTLQLVMAAAVAAVGVTQADPATFCVKDAQGLKAALSLAQANGEDDVIQLQAGDCTPSAARFSYPSDEAHSLTLAGSYFTLPESAACAFQLAGAGYSRVDGAVDIGAHEIPDSIFQDGLE